MTDKRKTLATRRGSLRSSVVWRLASVPPRSSVLPPGAGNKPEKAVQPKKERAKNPDERRVVEAGVHWHGQAAAVGRHDDGNMAAITAVEHAQDSLPLTPAGRFPGHVSGSLRGRARSRNPPDPTGRHRVPTTGFRGRPAGFGAETDETAGWPAVSSLSGSRWTQLLPALTGLDDESRACERREDEEDPEGLSLEHAGHLVSPSASQRRR